MMGALYILPFLSATVTVCVVASLFILLKLPPLTEIPMIKRSEPTFYYLTQRAKEIFGRDEIDTQINISSGTGGAIGISNYKLIATSIGDVKMALIGRGNDIHIIKEGEVFNGYEIKKIGKDFVLFSSPSGEYILRFPKHTVGGQRTVTSSTGIKREGNTVVISRRELERLTSDPGIMFNQVRLVPYIQNGRTKGFKFEWIQPNSLLAKAGLKPGDILIAINNMQITSGEDAFRILQVLRNETSFKISIIRNGREMDLTLRVE